MLAWALLVLQGADGLQVNADESCDRVLLSTLRAELQVSGYTIHDDLRADDAAQLQLTCDEALVKVRLEVPSTQTTIERRFAFTIELRALVAVKLSEFIHASLRPPTPALPPLVAAPVIAEPPTAPLTVVASNDDAPIELPGTWHVGVALMGQATPHLGIAPGLMLHLIRRIDEWEVGLWAQGGLSFPTIQSVAGSVSMNFALAVLTVARRFQLTPRFRLRALAGPGVLIMFANGTSTLPVYVGRFIAKPAFAATVGAMAEYDVSADAHLFLGVNVSWSIPRAVLGLPEGDRTIAEPIVTAAAGVIF